MSRKKAKAAKAEWEDMGTKPVHAHHYALEEDWGDDQGGWCDHCQNTGELDCHCGGDLCVCENSGTYPCPHCN